ncbi:MAG: cellulase family glycosylhydrolase, partial [Phycisphaerae bacterium]|nr:cellulase family glycosylhydrolase [Phycisphaerae bacterium]
ENNPGPFHSPRPSNWDLLNAVYRRVVEAIRAIDPHHIVFLDGDRFSGLFEGLDAPFADNLVYCFHSYMSPGMGPGPYPGKLGREMWDRAKILAAIVRTEGYKYARKHSVPLCCGEFGALFTGPAEEKADRIRGAGEQADVFEELDIHWTTVTYKDVGLMGWAMTDPQSPFMQAVGSVLEAKQELQAICWGTVTPGAVGAALSRLAEVIKEHCPEPDLDAGANEAALRRYALVGYAAGLLQTPFARCFKDMSEGEMDSVLGSFRIENCVINRDFVDVLKKSMQR